MIPPIFRGDFSFIVVADFSIGISLQNFSRLSILTAHADLSSAAPPQDDNCAFTTHHSLLTTHLCLLPFAFLTHSNNTSVSQ